MTQDDIIAFVTSLPGVVSVTASEAIGAPEVAWVIRSSSTTLTAISRQPPDAVRHDRHQGLRRL